MPVAFAGLLLNDSIDEAGVQVQPSAYLWAAVIQSRQSVGQQAWLVVVALPQVQHPVADGAQELEADLREAGQ